MNEYASVPSADARLTGRALGIDVGGTGIKAAVIDLASGQLVTERIRARTPRRATPQALLGVVVDVVRRLEATGVLTPDMPGGAGFPSVIRAGRALTATQLHRSWIGAPVHEMLEQRLGRSMVVLNDADAAGVGEMALGAGQGQSGVVLLLALGTGIGSALFIDGQLSGRRARRARRTSWVARSAIGNCGMSADSGVVGGARSGRGAPSRRAA